MPIALRRFTVDEVERMVRAGILHEDDRLELLDGQLVEMSPINPPHAACVNRLNRLFAPLLASGRATVSVQNALVLAKHQAPQPDLTILPYRANGYKTRNPHATDALLVIEVADTSAKSDRSGKIPRYAQAHIPEAWLVNLPGDTLEVYRTPRRRTYTDVRTVRRGESLSPAAFPGLVLRADDILG